MRSSSFSATGINLREFGIIDQIESHLRFPGRWPQIQRRQLVAIGVGDQAGDDVGEVVHDGAMTRMLDLADVLELVQHRLDDRPLPQQQLCPTAASDGFHVGIFVGI